MATCWRKLVVKSNEPDKIEKILINKESGDGFSETNRDDEGGNNRQKQDLAPGEKKTMGNNETLVSQRSEYFNGFGAYLLILNENKNLGTVKKTRYRGHQP
ncbi:hypothetical protein TNCT_312551 [Trichonephila clavata]|uniref:Uncharacterized protein n=1 Tax=Trichonephila clavata TaxID=2740835 RepID=A0A8X6FBW9_TRICU|nr:hypothetical protein TNCT_312551 [Trichonephila clavata]